MEMADDKALILSTSDFELALAPAVGGGIQRLEHIGTNGARTPVLRGSDDKHASVLDMGSFPLVPYCNRIRNGRFRFRGREIAQPPNMVGDASPLHGHGWLAPWEVEHADEREARLSYRHEPGEWPWRYEALQTFKLDEVGLAMSLSCRNLSHEPMPCGLGIHPYFHCTAETVLDTKVGDVWTVDEHVLPVERISASGRYDLQNRRICGQDLDNGYSDWSGEALIRTPGIGFAIRITSSNASFFQVYSPNAGGLFVAEPVSHANAALNEPEETWSRLGLRILDPEETMTLSVRIDIVST